MGLKDFLKEKQFEKTNGGTITIGDYKYRFNQEWNGEWWEQNSSLHGYGVRVLDNTKSEYGEIQSEIDGIPVVSMKSTFYGCKNMIKSPEIPNTIKVLERTFEDCEKLINAPDIPKGAKNLEFIFAKCSNLKSPPEIPDGVKTMYAAFWNCSNLEKLPDIPDSVKQTGYIFEGCPKDTLADTLLSDNAPINTDFTTDIDEKSQDSHEEL